MKLLLIGPLSKTQRLMASGLASSQDHVVLVLHGGEMPDQATLAECDAAVLDWEPRAEPPAEVLGRLRRQAPALPVLVLVKNEAERADALAGGAGETVVKPVDIDGCRGLLRNRVWSRTKEPTDNGAGELKMIAQSEAMKTVLSVAWRAAPTTASILILGENGTGKTQLARAIHARSGRATGPFVAVNCPCLQPALMESELFGHVRGAFTGAVGDTTGKVAVAEGGTLFLDEIGELPLEIQAKLLRLLQERCYERVGEARTRRADIRVLAATNRDLRQQVAANAFREDLYYRLNVITLEMPPLRGRPEDIVPLAEYFLGAISETAGGPRRELTVSAREALAAHAWPGNLRELRNVIERAAILCDREWLEAADFPELTGRTAAAAPQVGEFVTLDALVEAHIRQVTDRAESYEQAARILGIDKSTLYRWRKRLGSFDPATVEAVCAS